MIICNDISKLHSIRFLISFIARKSDSINSSQNCIVFLFSRLDSDNALLNCFLSKLMECPQRTRNSTARLVTCTWNVSL